MTHRRVNAKKQAQLRGKDGQDLPRIDLNGHRKRRACWRRVNVIDNQTTPTWAQKRICDGRFACTTKV